MKNRVKFQAVRGAKDILPAEVGRWQHVERTFRGIFGQYGFTEIRVPIFEETALFARGLGETSDIVEKEMYTFEDRSGNSLTLRPEGTAPVVRAFLEHHFEKLPPPVKLFYLGPMFRYERPQKGRSRQFYQIGAEVFGVAGAAADAELLEMLHEAFRRLEVPGLELQVNSLGDPACRPAYRRALVEHFRPLAPRLCENCRRRLDTNPLRILDCKEDPCRDLRRGAPDLGDFLCDPCREHFAAVRGYLDEWGVPHRVNPAMVRGLDYYTRTAFEMTSRDLGSQDAVAAGGRYDGLVEEFGGPPTPGLGFALGMERLVSLLPEGAGSEPDARPVFFAALGDPARRRAFHWLTELRRRGVPAEGGYEEKSLKSQMRRADRLGARYVLIVGEDELASGKVLLRDMESKSQEQVEIGEVVEKLSTVSGHPAER
jgi:histidyl-tRNA synthetase